MSPALLRLALVRCPGAEAAWAVPGRIELLGKHTDYLGGPSLVCAADRGFVVAVRADGGDGVRIAGDRGACALALDGAGPDEGWARYAGAVVRRLARDFPGAARPVAIGLASDLPPAAGLSSSSALVVALAEALRWAWALDRHPAWLPLADRLARATYWSCLENGRACAGFAADGGVGTAGGSEDHVAILCARAGHASLFRYAPVVALAEPAWPADVVAVVLDSGVRAEKTGAAMAAYNACAERHAEAVTAWNAATGRSDPHLSAAFAAAGSEAVLARLDGEQRRRAEHAAIESAIVLDAAARLAAGDRAGFAAALRRSQDAAERLLGNQIPATIRLCRLAEALDAPGATAFGAGFGGAVWALHPASGAEAFAQAWRSAAGPGAGEALIVRPGPGLHPVEIPA